MDKYEFNIKVEQIKKMVSRGDYETAMKIADTIDWRRVRNVNILSMVATIYEKNEEYQEAKDILLLAFERAPIGKRLLFKLAELAIKEGSFQEAEDYYREFCDLAPDDPRQYILRYLILGAKGAPAEQLIHTLEQYCNIELDEKWIYELAELYAEAGMGELCIMTCDKIMLMFGLGKYVEKAMELKIQFAPLTKYQMDLVENRDKYEARLKAVEQEYRAGKGLRIMNPCPRRKRKSLPSPTWPARRLLLQRSPKQSTRRTDIRKVDTQKAGIRRTDTQKTDTRKTDTQMMGMQRTDIRKAGMRKTDIRRRDTQNAGIGMTGMPRMNIRMTDIQKQDTRRTIIQSMIIRKADIRQRHIRKIPIRMKMVLRRYMHGRAVTEMNIRTRMCRKIRRTAPRPGIRRNTTGLLLGQRNHMRMRAHTPGLP